MQISHAATGAAVGKFIPNPFLAFVAGILIHFIIDKIPHFWPESKKGKTIFVVLDYAVTYAVVIWLLIKGVGNLNIWMGVAGSLMVDNVIIGIPQIFRSKLGRWHTNRQPHQTKLISLFADAIVTSIGLLIVFYL